MSAATLLAAGPAPAQTHVRVVGGTKAERALARLVATRIGGVTIRSVRFRPPAPALHRLHVRGPELVVASSEPQTVRGTWESHLYAGTFVALLARYRLPLGAIAAGGSVGPLRLWRPFDLYSTLPTSKEIGALELRLAEAAARAGAQVIERRTAATPSRAIALTLRVADPAEFLKHRALRLLNVLYSAKTELLGFYVGLEDGTGTLVWATSRLPNEGAVFAVPALDACSPVAHSEAYGHTPPPCPAR